MIKGKISIYKINDGGEHSLVAEKENLVTKRTYLEAINGTSPIVSSRRLAISVSTRSSTIDGYSNLTDKFNIQNMNNIIAAGYNSSDGGSYTDVTGFTYTSSPNKVVFWGRIPFTGNNRTFSTVALVSGTPGSSLSLVTYPSYAYTTFESPIIQFFNEIIDIKYEFTVSWGQSYQEIYTGFKNNWEKFIFGQTTFPNMTQIQLIRRPLGDNESNFNCGPTESNKGASLTLTTNTNLFKRRYSGNLSGINSGDFATGMFLGCQTLGNSISYQKFSNSRRPLNNVYSHSSVSNNYLYDGTNYAGGSWKPIIEMVNPNQFITDTSGYPSIISLRITTGGDINAAKFKAMKQPFFGGVSVMNNNLGYPFTVVPFVPYYYNTNGYDPYVIVNINDDQVIVHSGTTFYLLNVKTGTVTGTYTVGTNANVVVVGMVYVPDLTTVYISTLDGLYSINLTNSIVTKRNSLACYGICITPDNSTILVWIGDGNGFAQFAPDSYNLNVRKSMGTATTPVVSVRILNNGKGFAYKSLFIDRWVSQDTSSVTSSSGLTIDEINCCYYIDSSGIGEVSSTKLSGYDSGQGYKWYSVDNTMKISSWRVHCPSMKSIMRSNDKSIIYALVSFYDNSGSGGQRYRLFSIKSTSSSANHITDIGYSQPPTIPGTYTGYGGPPCLTSASTEKLFVKYPKNNYYTTTNTQTNDSYAACVPCVHLTSLSETLETKIGSVSDPSIANEFWVFGLHERLTENLSALVSNYQVGVFNVFSIEDAKESNSDEWWGHNGTTWVKGYTNGASTSTSSMGLLDGTTVRWTDLLPANSQNFVVNNFYTQVIGDGIVFDGYQPSIPVSFSFYFREKISYNFSGRVITNTISISTLDSDFFRIDDDDITIHKLYINGNPNPAPIILNSTTPNQGEIGLVPTVGLYFHANDVGFNLDGTLIYVKKLHSTEV